jgi:hypothetical protein
MSVLRLRLHWVGTITLYLCSELHDLRKKMVLRLKNSTFRQIFTKLASKIWILISLASCRCELERYILIKKTYFTSLHYVLHNLSRGFVLNTFCFPTWKLDPTPTRAPSKHRGCCIEVIHGPQLKSEHKNCQRKTADKRIWLENGHSGVTKLCIFMQCWNNGNYRSGPMLSL